MAARLAGKCESEAHLPGPTACHQVCAARLLPPRRRHPLVQAFADPYCKFDWKCKKFTESCAEECYLCTFLVRDWPLFQEVRCASRRAANDVCACEHDR